MSRTHIGWREAHKLRKIEAAAEQLSVVDGEWSGEQRQAGLATVTDRQESDGNVSRSVSWEHHVKGRVVVSQVVVVPGEFDHRLPSVRVSQGETLEAAKVLYDSDEHNGIVGLEGLKTAAETLRNVRDMQTTIAASYHNPSVLT